MEQRFDTPSLPVVIEEDGDRVYIDLRPDNRNRGKISRSQRVSERLVLDFDKNDKLIGIEVR